MPLAWWDKNGKPVEDVWVVVKGKLSNDELALIEDAYNFDPAPLRIEQRRALKIGLGCSVLALCSALASLTLLDSGSGLALTLVFVMSGVVSLAHSLSIPDKISRIEKFRKERVGKDILFLDETNAYWSTFLTSAKHAHDWNKIAGAIRLRRALVGKELQDRIDDHLMVADLTDTSDAGTFGNEIRSKYWRALLV